MLTFINLFVEHVLSTIQKDKGKNKHYIELKHTLTQTIHQCYPKPQYFQLHFEISQFFKFMLSTELLLWYSSLQHIGRHCICHLSCDTDIS